MFDRTWLLHLYPRAWRLRYGAEIAALLHDRPASFAMVMDAVGGALDAHLAAPAPTTLQGETAVITVQHFTCSCRNSPQPRAEQIRHALGAAFATLLLSVLFVALKRTYGNTPAIEAFGLSLLPATMVLWANSTYLSQRSWRTQAVFVGGLFAALYAIGLLSTL